MSTTIYTVYRTTNLVNGKIYIGVHKQPENEPLRYYLGSGKIFNRAIEKYGEDKFFKKITHVFDNSIDMYDMESYIVDNNFVARKDTYNIKLGGSGGWDYVNDNMSNADRIRIAKKGGNTRHISEEEYSKRIRNGLLNAIDSGYTPIDNFGYVWGKGCTHTNTTIEKMKVAKRKDLSIYNFKNKNTEETFSGTRYDFTEKYNLIRLSVNAMINKQKNSLFGWYII